MGSSRRFRRVFALLLSVSLLTIAVGTAWAAPSRPTVTIFVVNTGATLAVQTTVNRASKQILSCSYVLDSGGPVPCGTRTNSSKSTTYLSSPFPTPAPGAHTVVVTVRLTDGGGGTASVSWTISAPPSMLAVAWSNVDGVPGYQGGPGGTDVLIMGLEDTNRDNVVSVGDTVIADQFPLDTAASGFGTWGLRSQLVTDAGDHGGGILWVGTATGDVAWARDANAEGASFSYAGGSLSPAVVDWYSAAAVCEDGDVDLVYTNVGEPLNPDVDAGDQACDTSDNSFVDVAIYVTP